MIITRRNLGIMAFAAFAAVGLTNCTDLEPEDSDSVFREQVDGVAIPGNPGELVNAAYNNLAVFTDQANVYSLMQHSSDELIPPTRGVDWGDNGVWRTLHAHTWDPTHAFVLSGWNDMNGRLFATQEILAGDATPQQQADARFLQGFYTWHILDLFGQVPFREFTDGVDDLPRVISRADAIDQAIENVESAIGSLPSQGPGLNVQGSKAAAYNMLTRMYLNKAVYQASNPAGPYEFDNADLQKVVEYADLVTAEGYSFEDDYFSIFEAGDNSEVILYSNNGSPQNRYYMTLHYDSPLSGWNGFTTIAELYDSFDENDPRFGEDADPDGTQFSGIGTGFLEGQQFSDNGDPIIEQRGQTPLIFTKEVPLAGATVTQGIRVIKYHPGRSDKYVIMRYAESQLNKAEAMFRMGDAEGARQVINEMRTARGGDEVDSVDEDFLLDERARELYWEGLRRVDQVRFGTFTGDESTWTGKDTPSDASRVLFPIPQQAIDSNPNLSQNPGY
ncbi:RagB/SusD family nutrient uptake outer membrane protein [Lewinella sp. 4G2]|uniref:RagB/SusD family nutrient uptake outer membrane protein n=1 Tax=Lewinella sp. 4G2 TaxID=1803372 RepID=UPI0007DEE8FB|nr:RagB/SusD family nutrient uptake outer membrane protein [Lewinella sp. 4G2]OAV44528.1 hypothetical protein A3850_008505 [Lewinella sp. 4G2]